MMITHVGRPAAATDRGRRHRGVRAWHHHLKVVILDVIAAASCCFPLFFIGSFSKVSKAVTTDTQWLPCVTSSSILRSRLIKGLNRNRKLYTFVLSLLSYEKIFL